MKITLSLVLGLGIGLAAGHRHPHWHHRPHSSKTSVSSTSSLVSSSSLASVSALPSNASGNSNSSLPPSYSWPSTPPSPSSSSASSSSSAPAATATGAVWQPEVNSTWQIVLDGAIALSADAKSVTPDVSVYDIDLFGTDASVIDALHGLGKRVICYFSAGSFEDGRPDSGDFQDSDKGNQLDGWPEYWLDTNSANVRSIMTKRIALAKEKNCDALDPDNVDGYNNDNGLGLTSDDAVDYITFLANEAKSNGLAIGLKNALEIVPKVLSVTQFQVNEQCAEYGECDKCNPFIEDGKPVFHIEYPSNTPVAKSAVKSSFCDADNFSTVLKTMDLDGWVQFCNGATATTPVED